MNAIPDFLYWYRAKCINVVDGDTIDVVTDLGFRDSWEHRVRLAGLDAYELNDDDGACRRLAAEGKAFVAAKVQGKDVILNTMKDRPEKYGRWLAVVYYLGADGSWLNLNEGIVAEGLAIPMKR